jgi:hypothetical protein
MPSGGFVRSNENGIIAGKGYLSPVPMAILSARKKTARLTARFSLVSGNSDAEPSEQITPPVTAVCTFGADAQLIVTGSRWCAGHFHLLGITDTKFVTQGG